MKLNVSVHGQSASNQFIEPGKSEVDMDRNLEHLHPIQILQHLIQSYPYAV